MRTILSTCLNARLRWTAATLLAIAISITNLSWAQTKDQDTDADNDKRPIEEIIVTARFRKESAQDIGQSITAFSGTEIDDAGIKDFQDFALRTPGLDFSDLGPNRNTPRMRGISNAIFTNDLGSVPPLVSSSINDVPITVLGFNQWDVRTFDLNRIEVLRGPQGTFFGEGAVGGAIRYFMTEPTMDRFSSKFAMGYSDIASGGNGSDIDIAANVPLSGTAAVRVSGWNGKTDGFIDNTQTGKNDTNFYETTGGRFNFLWNVTDKFRFNTFAMVEEVDLGASFIVNEPASKLKVSRPGPDEGSDQLKLVGLDLRYNAGSIEFHSISGLVKRKQGHNFYSSNFTSALPLLTNPDGPLGFLMDQSLGLPSGGLHGVVTNDQNLDTENYTQEFRIVSQFDGPFNFVAGAFYKDGHFVNHQFVGTPLLEPYIGTAALNTVTRNIKTKQKSLFFDANYRFSERYNLLFGVRAFDEKVHFDLADLVPVLPLLGQTATSDGKVKTMLPRVALEYTPNTDTLLYASVSQGARSGGLNTPSVGATTGPDALEYGADKVTAYELGAKLRLADGSVTLNAALYLNDWNNIQIFLSDAVTGFSYMENGPDARIHGAEVELNYALNQTYTLFLGANWTSAKFVSCIVIAKAVSKDCGDPANVGVATIDKGDHLAYTPDYTANLGVQAYYPAGKGAIVARADFQTLGNSVSDVGGQTKLKGYDRLNLRLTYEKDNWHVGLYVNNATNDISVIARSLADQYITRPRVIGVTLGADF